MNDNRKDNIQGLKRHKILTGVLCLSAVWMAYLIFSPAVLAIKPTVPSANRYQKGKIFLEHADSLTYQKRDSAHDYQVLRGNVKFRKADMFMYCDSAHFYDQQNRMDAFSNVKMEQGDTLFVYADVLHYDGNTELARLRKITNGVRLEHRNTTLFTDSLDYDLLANVGFYFKGGRIVDDKNEITSIYGQ